LYENFSIMSNLKGCCHKIRRGIESVGYGVSQVYNKALILATTEKTIPFRKAVKVAVQSNYAAFLTS